MRHSLPNGIIHEGPAEEFYEEAEPGYSLIISDGAYGMQKAEWDRVKVDALPDWYRHHMEAWTRLAAPAASVYLWNTAEGWARLDPVMRALGWRFRSLITWERINSQSQKGYRAYTCWPDDTEVCGFYQRSTISRDLRAARLAAGARGTDVDVALGYVRKSDPSRGTELFRRWEEGSSIPSRDDYNRAMEYLIGAGRYPEYAVPAFDCPQGTANVWPHPQITGPNRLRGDDGKALHPCQKPLLFAERMIRASTRPGDRVLVPFGGTCREAVVCEWLGRTDPEQARRYDVCELNQDPGKDYIGPVLDQIAGRSSLSTDDVQGSLFT